MTTSKADSEAKYHILKNGYEEYWVEEGHDMGKDRERYYYPISMNKHGSLRAAEAELEAYVARKHRELVKVYD